MARLNIETQREQDPKRLEYAINKIESLGYEVKVIEDSKALQFDFKGSPVTLWVYSGWHSGKTIIDGRGIAALIKQIKP